MLTFIEMEFLKLKRSNIFLLSIMGAILPPLLMFIATFAFDETQTFEMLFSSVNMYMSALFAILLFAIMISYLFGREYNEHTLKTMLTIPVSRGKFLMSKYIMFLAWILILTMVTSMSTMVFGFVAGLEGFSAASLCKCFAVLNILALRVCISANYQYGSCNGWRGRLDIGQHVDLWPDLGTLCSLGMPISDCIRRDCGV